MNQIDLHVHSRTSDGTNTPSELVDLAANIPLSAFALTDHDTVQGVHEAVLAGKQKGIEVIPGIELSVAYKNSDIHILGLFIDYQNKTFLEKLQYFSDSRAVRNIKMIKALNDLGCPITLEEVIAETHDGSVTRMHFAVAMEKGGYVKNREQAFSKYIGDDCPGYVARELLEPKEAIELIKSAGGIAILAHPFYYGYKLKEIDKLVEYLTNLGLQGIEALYSTHSRQDTDNIITIANKYKLALSGGSDFHGTNKPYLKMGIGKGNLQVPYEILENLKNCYK